MKLRNKKTGEIVEAESCNTTTGMIGIFYHNEKGILTLGSKDCFETLAELNEEWEDYKPAEPLIKDEKIRKAVRAWAEANDLLVFKVVNEHFGCFKIIGYGDHNISPRIEFKSTIAHANKDQYYTIAELCGEEEE